MGSVNSGDHTHSFKLPQSVVIQLCTFYRFYPWSDLECHQLLRPGAVLSAPPWVTLALKLRLHECYLMWLHLSKNSEVSPPFWGRLRHHLPPSGVKVEVGSRARTPPLASSLRGTHSPAAQSGRWCYIHQVRTQGVIDVGFDSVACCLRPEKTERTLNRTENISSYTTL